MNRSVTSSLLAGALIIATATSAMAGVVSAANSTFPPCLVTCPMGDLHAVVIARDLANNPLNGVFVSFDFSQCPGAYVCPTRPSDPYTYDPATHRVTMVTNATGTADLPLRVGGVGAAGSVQLFANGILLASYALASPDQNGNGVVTGIVDVDPALFAAKLGTVDPTAAFDCSGGAVDAADQLIFNQHLSHSCDGIVDAVQRRTWGTLKSHYR